MMKYGAWLYQVKDLFQNSSFDYHEVAEHCSFYKYWQDQHTPERAVELSIELMDA